MTYRNYPIIAFVFMLTVGHALSGELREFTNSIGMRFRLIPAGEFMMGSSMLPEELAREFGGDPDRFEDECPQHKVCITKPFYLGVTEVTQEQYKRIMNRCPWSETYARIVRGDIWEGNDYPAYNIRWDDAMEFCRKLSVIEARNHRLPTETEWEYACRAGAVTMWCCGDDPKELESYCWFDQSAFGELEELVWWRHTTRIRFHPRPVAQKKPNAWGLYDMHGNVREWCSDWYSEDYCQDSLTHDPKGPAKGSFWIDRNGHRHPPSHVCRGGSFYLTADSCRSAWRGGISDDGFRVAVEFDEQAGKDPRATPPRKAEMALSRSPRIVRVPDVDVLLSVDGFGRARSIPYDLDGDQKYEELADLSLIKSLILDGTTDDEMHKFSFCSQLEILDLSNPRMTNDGYCGIARLAALKRCTVRDVFFEPSVPITDIGLSHFSQLTTLEHLTVENSVVTDGGLNAVAKLQELKHLCIRSSMIKGNGLKYLKRLRRLESLELGSPRYHLNRRGKPLKFDDSTRRSFNNGLRHVAGLRNLRWLKLPGSPVSDEGLAILTPLPRLRILNLNWTNVTDSGISRIHKMKTLRAIRLHATNVTAKGMEELRAAIPQAWVEELEPLEADCTR